MNKLTRWVKRKTWFCDHLLWQFGRWIPESISYNPTEVIQTECSRLEQRSVIKLFLIEKCKPCEICRRMCNVCGEALFPQKMFTNELNIGLSLQTWVKKTIHGMEMYWLSSKEKVLGSVISKEGHAVSVLGYEKTHHY